jgi:hypothetical protein
VHAVLASIKLTGEGGDTPFLDDEQLALISEPVARALRSAGANQDVVFAVHYVSVMSLLGPPKTTAGRLFAEGDGIGVILGQVQSTYVRNYVSLDRSLIRTGARGAAQETRFHIVPGGAVSLVQSDRGDRAHISPLAWTGTYGMPPLSAPAAPAAPVAPAAPALYAPPTAPTAPVAAPPPPPPPAAPAALLAVPPPSDPLQIEQRFAALKRLLDAQLISPADYDKAKAELLQAISTLPPR